METKAIAEELLLAVIRGQLPLRALHEAGISVDFEFSGGESGERRISVRAGSAIKVSPKPIDIANGLLAYRNQPEELRDWAAFVLAASDIIDLSSLEEWPEGDELLSGVWDASFEGRFKPETERVASTLAGH